MALKIFRPLGGNAYMTVSHDGPHPLTASAVNTFPVNLQVERGDVLGVDTSGTGNIVGCLFQFLGETYWGSFPEDPNDGEQATFFSANNYRVNVAAQFDPSHDFSFTGTTRNKKKGRATTTVSVPGPGDVAVGGKGLAAQSRHTDGGAVTLGVVPNRKTRNKLLAKGKARVTASFTYTPDGGSANTQPEKVKLILR
jgi:hypothetical protein